MKSVKAVILVLALVVMGLSLKAVDAGPGDPLNKDLGGDGGYGSYWNVTCNYGPDNKLVSHTCTTGGEHPCTCD